MAEFTSSTAEVRGEYRYTLTRIWDPTLPVMTFVLLNPSTADAEQLDPTLRRCVGFAKREGYGGMVILNLYAFRATDPKVHALGVTKDGHPKHPLYVPADAPLVDWMP